MGRFHLLTSRAGAGEKRNHISINQGGKIDLIGEVSGCWNSLIPMTPNNIEDVRMSMQQIIAIADSLVKGWEVKVPALKATEWDELRWWLDYLKGYDI